MRFVTCLVVALSAFGTTSITSITSSPTQAVIVYITDQAGACTVRASESVGLTPLVHDVDPTLFTGSDMDDRTGAITSGSTHTFVLGTRRADIASDDRNYSRALQAATAHYVGITCGMDSEVTSSFTTQNPPLGQSAPEAPPFLGDGFGNYAWPSIDWEDGNATYVDPMTGILLKRMTSPGWKARTFQNNDFGAAFDLNSAWTNEANALTWPGTGTVATYSGASNDPLFLAIDLSTIAEYGSGALRIGGWEPLNSIDDLMVRAYGNGDNATTANRNILVCLSNDSGATCASDEQTVTLPQTTNANASTIPAAYPKAAWTDWTGANFNGHDFGNVITTVTTSGTTITNLASSASSESAKFFSRSWGAGCKVLVNGSETYTIASVNSGSSITTVETMTTHGSAVTFKSWCSGIRIVKETGTGSISLSAGYDVAVSAEYKIPESGARDMCSSVPVEVTKTAAGAPAAARDAHLCIFKRGDGNVILVALFPDTGETRLLSTFDSRAGWQYHSPDWTLGDGNEVSIAALGGGNNWHKTIGTRFYTRMVYGSGHYTLIQIDYTGDFTEYTPGWVVGGSYSDDGLTYTGLNWASAGEAVEQLAEDFGNANFDPAIYDSISFSGVTDDGKAVWNFIEQQDDPSIVVIQDVDTGAIDSVTDDITTYPRRFFGTHGVVIASGRVSMVGNILGSKIVPSTSNYLGGPWVMVATEVYKSGAWNANTSLAPSDVEACPSDIDAQWQAKGATGNECVRIRAKQPCSSYAGATELSRYPCPWDAGKSMIAALAPGDRFWVDTNCAGAGGCDNAPETMRVVTTPTNAGTGIVEFWALRGSHRFANLGPAEFGGGSSPATLANGWDATMIPPEARTVSTVWVNDDGTSLPDIYNLGSTHFDVGPGYSSSLNATTVGGGESTYTYGIRWDRTLASQVGDAIDYEFSDRGIFHGAGDGGGSMESYISMRQKTASAAEKRWFLDLRHISPTGGDAQERFAAVGNITASLVAGTTGVHRFTAYPGKSTTSKYSPAIAYAGRYLLQDMSSDATGDVIDDNTTYSFCRAYKVNECRTGSSVGDVYTSVPQVDSAGVAANYCVGGWYATTNPCVFAPYPMHFFGVQVGAQEPTDNQYWRKLTTGLSGPGRQYQYGNFISTPDGTWAFMQGYWLDGKRNEIIGVKLPPWPTTSNGVDDSDFIPISVTVTGSVGSTARAKFGYAEHGDPATAFNCTSRIDPCVTDESAAPFAYLNSDSLTPKSCASGCTLSIPAISGRTLYYVVERLDGGGSVVSTSDPVAVMVGADTQPVRGVVIRGGVKILGNVVIQ